MPRSTQLYVYYIDTTISLNLPMVLVNKLYFASFLQIYSHWKTVTT